MKTVYCIMNLNPAKIVLTDDLVCRIKFLQKKLRDFSEPKQGILNENENVLIELTYGTFRFTPPDSKGIVEHLPTAEGPVLVYGDDTCRDHNMRCADDVISVIIRPEGSILECMGHDGAEHPLFPEQDILDLPEIFFSNDFIRHVKDPFFKSACEAVVEDMPQDHRDFLESKQEVNYGE